MARQDSPALREQLRERLRRQLGEDADVVSVEQSPDRSFRGVAVCSGTILRYVLDAEQERLRTSPLFELLQQRRVA
jgi:hypothetical protein